MSDTAPQPCRSTYATGQHAIAAAMLVATLAHAGQLDKLSAPYIDHPRRVARYLRDQTWQVQVVAWLHDVVEDTVVTLEAIRQAFGPVIADAVDAITHRPHESRVDYYARVKGNAIALVVKEADIADNTDPARTAGLDPQTRQRLATKYVQARDVLGLSARETAPSAAPHTGT